MDEEQPKAEISTFNRFGVSIQGEKTLIMFPQTYYSSTEALQIAAWLVAVNADRMDEFHDLLGRVMNT